MRNYSPSLSWRLRSLSAIAAGLILTTILLPVPALADAPGTQCGATMEKLLQHEDVIWAWDPATGTSKWIPGRFFDYPPVHRTVSSDGQCKDINVSNLNAPPPGFDPVVSTTYWSTKNARMQWGIRGWVVAYPGGAEIQTITSIANGTKYWMLARWGAIFVKVRT